MSICLGWLHISTLGYDYKNIHAYFYKLLMIWVLNLHRKQIHEHQTLNQGPVFGIRASQRSYQSAGPSCKSWRGENAYQQWFVCFHLCWSEGAYCERPGTGSVQKCEIIRAAASRLPPSCGPCMSLQSSSEVHLLPTAHQPQTQLTLAVFVIFSLWNFLPQILWGLTFPRKGKKGRKKWGMWHPLLGCVCRAVRL